MSKSNHDIFLLEGLLNKYDFVQPVPLKIQERMLSVKKNIFKKILKTLGIYSFFSGIFISIYFSAKKLGFSIFISKIIISTITIASISTGTYFAANHIVNLNAVQEKGAIESSKIVIEPGIANVEKISNTTAGNINYTLGIKPFISSSVDKKILNKAVKIIAKELSNQKGNNFLKIFSDNQLKNVKYSLLGSMEKTGDAITLNIKVIDIESSTIVFLTRESIESVDGLNNACVKISNQIASRLE